MVNQDRLEGLIGGIAFDRDGEKIGKIGMIYLDDQTGEPAWASVNTGLFGTHESFVPLDGATVDERDLKVPFTKEQVREAPTLDVDEHLDVSQEDALYSYYGITGAGADPDVPAAGSGPGLTWGMPLHTHYQHSVDGAYRGDSHEPGHAPANIADDAETNVGGAPRHLHTAGGQGQAPAMRAREHEGNVGGAPRDDPSANDAPAGEQSSAAAEPGRTQPGRLRRLMPHRHGENE